MLFDHEIEGAGGDNAHVIVQDCRFAFHFPVEQQPDMLIADQCAIDKQVNMVFMHTMEIIPDLNCFLFRMMAMTRSRRIMFYWISSRTAVSSH